MANRKLQIYVTESQYRLLKQRAGRRGSLTGVVRDLIDHSADHVDPKTDPFFRHVVAEKDGSGEPYAAENAKRDLYRRPA